MFPVFNRILHRRQSGMTLLEQIISLAIFGIVVVNLSVAIKNGLSSAQKFRIDQERTSIKKIIVSGLSCVNTLKPFTPPYVCATMSNITLKHNSNKNLFVAGHVGKWKISAKCETNEIIIAAERTGGTTYSDIFDGMSDFCRKELENTPDIGWITMPCSGISTRTSLQKYCISNKSPDEFCREAGFTSALGTCKGTRYGKPAQGGIFSSKSSGQWFTSCVWGNPEFGPPQFIRCVDY